VTRRTLTLAVAGFLVVLLSAVAALLPVPYVALNPGPVTNTLGSVGKTELIRIEGRTTYPDDGNLDLTTVSVLGGPRQRLDLVTALRGWIDDAVAVVP
jgi:PDZ domain-containing protein